MALTMKQKYERINLSKLPDTYQKEFKAIKEDSENFDPELVDIFEDNFNTLYGLVEKKYPDALKTGGTVKKTKPASTKVVKPKAKTKPKTETTYKVACFEDSYQFWASTEDKIEFSSMTDAKKYLKEKLEGVIDHRKSYGKGHTVKELWGEVINVQTKESKHFRLEDLKGDKSLKEFTPKSRGKKPESKKFQAKARGMKKVGSVEACRRVLLDAGYETKKKISKDGKKAIKHKAPRPERSIINEKVDDTFKTINKDISGSEEKDKKYKAMQGKLDDLKTLLTKLFNRLNTLAEQNETEKIEKIIKLLKEILD